MSLSVWCERLQAATVMPVRAPNTKTRERWLANAAYYQECRR